MAMQPMRARVKNGRLVLDEPTDLPEGDVVELVPIDDALAQGGADRDAARLRPPYRIASPRLARREEVADFEMKVSVEPLDHA